MTSLSVIIPANNEEAWIGPCLDAMRLQEMGDAAPSREIIVAANACTDRTLQIVEQAREGLEQAGWRLVVLDIATPGKLNALNQADAIATGRVLAYLDADVPCDPDLMRLLVQTLDTDQPLYASGQLKVAPSQSRVTHAFARAWADLPFMTTNVPGAGLFAVNRAGRARWDRFPDIIADDGFARLHFTPNERIKVDAAYHWPMVEGYSNLVKVRSRQDEGVRQLAALYPELMRNESKPPMRLRDHIRLFLKMPASYAVYVAVMLAVRARKPRGHDWTRGR
ncbi:glycosyltransferase family 2 protein [Aestuariivita boseongensis]|uniref:glycosyltransferase family 2 protein n=1 Tax=Aestuariivita boseongensis TaxID=1470562 RepID=UPI00067FAD79|nr:glycosyltransferase [Aestuariivita boseongensis]